MDKLDWKVEKKSRKKTITTYLAKQKTKLYGYVHTVNKSKIQLHGVLTFIFVFIYICNLHH